MEQLRGVDHRDHNDVTVIATTRQPVVVAAFIYSLRSSPKSIVTSVPYHKTKAPIEFEVSRN